MGDESMSDLTEELAQLRAQVAELKAAKAESSRKAEPENKLEDPGTKKPDDLTEKLLSELDDAGRKDAEERGKESDTSAWQSAVEHKTVRGLLKQMALPGDWRPLTEKQFDDDLESWRQKVRSFGYPENLCRFLVVTVASPLVIGKVNRCCHPTMDFVTFRDTLARNLFPFDRQLERLGQTIYNGSDRSSSGREAVVEYEQLHERYLVLLHRHGKLNLLDATKLKVGLLRKLPAPLGKRVLQSGQWQATDFDGLVRLVYQIEDSMDRDQELYASISNADVYPVIPTQTPPARRPTDYSKMTCYKCHQVGHSVSQCKQAYWSKCKVCGKTRHLPSKCWKLSTSAGRDISGDDVFIRETTSGMQLEMKGISSKEELLRKLSDHFRRQADREEEMKERAKENKLYRRELYEAERPENPYSRSRRDFPRFSDELLWFSYTMRESPGT